MVIELVVDGGHVVPVRRVFDGEVDFSSMQGAVRKVMNVERLKPLLFLCPIGPLHAHAGGMAFIWSSEGRTVSVGWHPSEVFGLESINAVNAEAGGFPRGVFVVPKVEFPRPGLVVW